MPSASTALAGNARFEAAGSLNAAVNATAAASALSPLVEPHVIMPSISAAGDHCRPVSVPATDANLNRIALFRLCKLLA